MNRLVDYPKYIAEVRDSDTSPMGSFSQDLLTPLGREALNGSRKFIGRLPRFRGANRKGMYLKFVLRPGERDSLLIFGDWLRDLGLEVIVSEPLSERCEYLKFDLR